MQLKIKEIFLDKKKKLKQLKIEYWEILTILSMKKKKIFGETIILSTKVMVIEMKTIS